MAKAETSLGVEILQQAIASGHTQRHDRSVSFTNGEAQFTSTSNVASHNRPDHSDSASVKFVDPARMPIAQQGWNQYYPSIHSTSNIQQVKPHGSSVTTTRTDPAQPAEPRIDESSGSQAVPGESLNRQTNVNAAGTP